jgi:hypothetical protein
VLGYNTPGASTDTYNNNNWLHGSKVVTGATGQTISSISAHVKGTVSASPNNRFRLAVYTDAGGRPGTLVAQTGEGTLVANSWNTLPIGATLAPNTTYWLIYNTNGTSPLANGLSYDVAGANSGGWSTGAVAYGSWPSSFGGYTASAARYSIYAQ